MKLKKLSIKVCNIIGITLILCNLFYIIGCIITGADFILCLMALLISLIPLIDLLISNGRIKVKFIYSFITTIVKLILISILFPTVIILKIDELNGAMTNYKLILLILIVLIIITIPSVFNTMHLIKTRKYTK